jgi:hypothetical protein
MPDADANDGRSFCFRIAIASIVLGTMVGVVYSSETSTWGNHCSQALNTLLCFLVDSRTPEANRAYKGTHYLAQTDSHCLCRFH